MTPKILIVDDRAVVRTELRNVLELCGEVEVTGEATDGWEALRQAELLKPDIVLMDLEMPGLDGIEATRMLKARNLAKCVIVLTVYGSEIDRQKAFEAGADAFLVKGTDLTTILNLFDHFSHREG